MKPWLLLPSALAHDLSPAFVKLYARVKRPRKFSWAPLSWRDLEFPNRLGLAGGVDKNGESIRGWWSLGAGFVEVGTVTPRPQEHNSGKILDRYVPAKALWNRMGFPNKGAEALARQLREIPRPHFTPIFVNIGKNRETPTASASRDYVTCIEKLSGLADVFVINISSPNTEKLRDLLTEQYLADFLRPIVNANKSPKNTLKTRYQRPTPLLLKIAPDLSEENLARILNVSVDLGLDGWILTNTTLGEREGLPFPAEGGVSGQPLARRSREFLARTLDLLGPRRKDRLIVSVGGVLSPEDVRERLAMGADLVQVYSALVFEGPFFFSHVARELSGLYK